MPNETEALYAEHRRLVQNRKPPTVPAWLGAFVDGAFAVAVTQYPEKAWVRLVEDNSALTVKHRNRVNLTTTNQHVLVDLYRDERGEWAILDLSASQGGAVLDAVPGVGIPAHTHPYVESVAATNSTVTVVNTDPQNPTIGLPNTAVTPASYTNTNLTVDQQGRITAASNGSTGSGGVTLYAATGTVTVANTTTETSLLSSGAGSLSLAGNWFAAGKALEFILRGVLKTKASSPGNFVARVGFTSGGTMVGGAGLAHNDTPIALTAGLSDRPFVMHGIIQCRSVGASGLFEGGGEYYQWSGTKTVDAIIFETNSGNFDTTGTLTFGFNWQFGTADANNSIAVITAFVREVPAP